MKAMLPTDETRKDNQRFIRHRRNHATSLQQPQFPGCPAQPIVPAQAGSAGVEPAIPTYSIAGKVTSDGTPGIPQFIPPIKKKMIFRRISPSHASLRQRGRGRSKAFIEKRITIVPRAWTCNPTSAPTASPCKKCPVTLLLRPCHIILVEPVWFPADCFGLRQSQLPGGLLLSLCAFQSIFHPGPEVKVIKDP